MNRLQWLLLALAVAGAGVLVASWDWRADDDAGTASASGSDEPDVYMENAKVRQFDAAGNLRYQLTAQQITHFSSPRHTLMTRPSLTLVRADGPPWLASADRGEMNYADNGAAAHVVKQGPLARESNAESMTDETVELAQHVVLSRAAGTQFIRVTTDQLTIKPTERTAHTDAAVLIVTNTGRTIAVGMEGELESEHLRLFSDPRQRVTTLVHSLTH